MQVYLFFAWNGFCNLETIHSQAYPEVLVGEKENTIYKNVLETAFADLILMLRRNVLSLNTGSKRARIHS